MILRNQVGYSHFGYIKCVWPSLPWTPDNDYALKVKADTMHSRQKHHVTAGHGGPLSVAVALGQAPDTGLPHPSFKLQTLCLLYTSDAADER